MAAIPAYPSEIAIYPNTPHGFNADYRPSYRAEQTKDGRAKLLAWFKSHGLESHPMA